MTNQTDNFPDLMHDDPFEVVMRGYSRRQVREHMDRTRNQIRDLEERLARALDQAEQSRLELAEARRKMAEAPQNPDELGERLSQILKLAQEEATANKQASEAEARNLRESAAAEAERLVTSAREQAEAIRTAAQEEAERRVADATSTSERLLAQAGAEAEETLGRARAEAEETVRSARAEADRQLRAAQAESERLLGEARGQAEAMLAAAQQRVDALDEHTGRRVAYLSDTHAEVVRRLSEIGSVLGDLMHREAAAGPLIDEAAVLPPAPQVHAIGVGGPDRTEDREDARHALEAAPSGHVTRAASDAVSDAVSGPVSDAVSGPVSDAVSGPVSDAADQVPAGRAAIERGTAGRGTAGHGTAAGQGRRTDGGEEEAVLVVDDGRPGSGHASPSPSSPEDTDVDLGRVRRAAANGEPVAGA